MSRLAPHHPSVVVYVNGSPYDHPAHLQVVPPSGDLPEPAAKNPAAMDPYRAHLEWPAMWSDYLHGAFAGPMKSERIAVAFQVSERTARKWLTGEGGCNGRHVRVAMDYDRPRAMRTLFDMAAE